MMERKRAFIVVGGGMESSINKIPRMEGNGAVVAICQEKEKDEELLTYTHKKFSTRRAHPVKLQEDAKTSGVCDTLETTVERAEADEEWKERTEEEIKKMEDRLEATKEIPISTTSETRLFTQQQRYNGLENPALFDLNSEKRNPVPVQRDFRKSIFLPSNTTLNQRLQRSTSNLTTDAIHFLAPTSFVQNSDKEKVDPRQIMPQKKSGPGQLPAPVVVPVNPLTYISLGNLLVRPAQGFVVPQFPRPSTTPIYRRETADRLHKGSTGIPVSPLPDVTIRPVVKPQHQPILPSGLGLGSSQFEIRQTINQQHNQLATLTGPIGKQVKQVNSIVFPCYPGIAHASKETPATTTILPFLGNHIHHTAASASSGGFRGPPSVKTVNSCSSNRLSTITKTQPEVRTFQQLANSVASSARRDCNTTGSSHPQVNSSKMGQAQSKDQPTSHYRDNLCVKPPKVVTRPNDLGFDPTKVFLSKIAVFKAEAQLKACKAEAGRNSRKLVGGAGRLKTFRPAVPCGQSQDRGKAGSEVVSKGKIPFPIRLPDVAPAFVPATAAGTMEPEPEAISRGIYATVTSGSAAPANDQALDTSRANSVKVIKTKKETRDDLENKEMLRSLIGKILAEGPKESRRDNRKQAETENDAEDQVLLDAENVVPNQVLVDTENHVSNGTINNTDEHHIFETTCINGEKNEVSHDQEALFNELDTVLNWNTPYSPATATSTTIFSPETSINMEATLAGIIPIEITPVELTSPTTTPMVITPASTNSVGKSSRVGGGTWRFDASGLKLNEPFVPVVTVKTRFTENYIRANMKVLGDISPGSKDNGVVTFPSRASKKTTTSPKTPPSHLLKDIKSPVSLIKYRCSVCALKFHTLNEIKVHACVPLYRCEDCWEEDRIFSSSKDLTEHLNLCHEKQRIGCEHCRTTVNCKTHLLKHMRRHHNDKLPPEKQVPTPSEPESDNDLNSSSDTTAATDTTPSASATISDTATDDTNSAADDTTYSTASDGGLAKTCHHNNGKPWQDIAAADVSTRDNVAIDDGSTCSAISTTTTTTDGDSGEDSEPVIKKAVDGKCMKMAQKCIKTSLLVPDGCDNVTGRSLFDISVGSTHEPLEPDLAFSDQDTITDNLVEIGPDPTIIFHCRLCNKGFRTNTRLKHHQEVCSSNRTPAVPIKLAVAVVGSSRQAAKFKTPSAPLPRIRNDRLDEMRRNWRSETQGELCRKCGKSSYPQSSLRFHQEQCRGTLDSNSKVPCPHCFNPKRTFSSEICLWHHMKAVHSEKLFKEPEITKKRRRTAVSKRRR